jgi:hypothetical protein
MEPVDREHIENLKSARRALINSRRAWAKDHAGGYQREKTEEAIKGITDVQRAIEAIDHALQDEGDLASRGL